MKKIIIPGLILAIFNSVYFFFVYDYKIEKMGFLILIGLLLSFIFFFLLLLWTKRIFFHSMMTFKQVFFNGILIGLIGSFTYSLFLFIFLTNSPSTMEVIRKNVEEVSEIQRQSIPDEAAFDANVKVFSFFQTPLGYAINQFGGIFLWILFSLISAPILRTKEKEVVNNSL